MPQDVLEWCGDALFAGMPDETVAFYRELVAAGFQYAIANILAQDLDTIDLMNTRLLPAFAWVAIRITPKRQRGRRSRR